jgi:hypothetical protein
MASPSEPVTDDTIQTLARERGYADASVVPLTVSERNAFEGDQGPWFVLSVKRNADDEWQMIGRRRTKADLIGLLK